MVPVKESPVTGMPTVTERSLQDGGSACVKLVGKVMDGPVLTKMSVSLSRTTVT